MTRVSSYILFEESRGEAESYAKEKAVRDKYKYCKYDIFKPCHGAIAQLSPPPDHAMVRVAPLVLRVKAQLD